MTDKQLKLIYEYMGWNKWGIDFPLNSNRAWECVQEMERKGDWTSFYFFSEDMFNKFRGLYFFTAWIHNPTNFFNCFSKWLEVKYE